MPRAQSELKTPTKGGVPYSKTKLEHSATTSPSLEGDRDIKPSKAKAKASGQVYDKVLLVQLVLKSAIPDWSAISHTTGKTETQCKDIWRKIIFPSLVSNKVWTTSGPGWSKEKMMAVVTSVLESCKPDWQGIAQNFDGRTKTQVHDVWRKVVLPKLKRGDAVE